MRVEMLLHPLQVRSRVCISKRCRPVTSSKHLRENPCSTDLSIVIRKHPITRRHCTGWAMCLVVICYYNGICHGLRDQIILIIFYSEDDPRKELAMTHQWYDGLHALKANLFLLMTTITRNTHGYIYLHGGFWKLCILTISGSILSILSNFWR